MRAVLRTTRPARSSSRVHGIKPGSRGEACPATLVHPDISAVTAIDRRSLLASTVPAPSAAPITKIAPRPYSIFRRTPDGPYWVRFSIRGEGQLRRALDTHDPVEAERRAFEVWSEAHYRAKQGLRSQARTFRQVAEEFIALIEREAERGERRQHQVKQWRGVVTRYFCGFPGFRDRAIESIRDPDVVRFWAWRADYWTSGPGRDVTLLTYIRAGRQIRKPVTAAMRRPPTRSGQRSEAVVLRTMLRQAARWGYIKEAGLPEVEVPRVPPNARPSFEAHEFSRLEAVSLDRLTDPAINSHVRRDRAILHAWISIGAFTGTRPTEALNLNWGDVLGYREGRDQPLGERDIRLRVRGKGKSRTFVPMAACITSFDVLWDLWRKAMDRDPEDGNPVFATSSGKRLGSLKRGLTELLRAADLLTDHRGARRTSYSLRHFHISQQLIAGVDVFLLAKNCGTSSAMIDRFYGQVQLEHMTVELRPEWRPARQATTPTNHP